MMVRRGGEIWNVNLDPTRGAEMKKRRPCLVVSVDSLESLPLKVVVPVTGWKDHFTGKPWLLKIRPNSKNGLDRVSAVDCLQVRCVAKDRFCTKLGQVHGEMLADVIGAIGLVVGI